MIDMTVKVPEGPRKKKEQAAESFPSSHQFVDVFPAVDWSLLVASVSKRSNHVRYPQGSREGGNHARDVSLPNGSVGGAARGRFARSRAHPGAPASLGSTPHDFPRGRSPPVSRPSPPRLRCSPGSKSQFAAGQLTSKFQKMAVAAPVKAAKVNTTVESECHLPVSKRARNLFIQ